MLLTLALAAYATPDVVFVGNSYTDRNELAGMVDQHLQAMLPRDLEARYLTLTQGGATWEEHVGWLTSKEQWQGAFASPQDVVVLQEQSQIPGFPETDPAYIASRVALGTLIDAAEGTGAWPILYLTWGRRDGDADNPALYPDYPTMQDRLEAGYRAHAAAMVADGHPVTVAPVGPAFRAVWAASPDPAVASSPFQALYAADGSHPSPAGSYLAAAVIASSITGREPLPVEIVGVSTSVAEALLPVAWQTVADDPFGEDGYRWAMDWEDWFADHLADEPISEVWWTPWVRVQGMVTANVVELGDDHGVGTGEGRLIVDGGDLTVTDELVVGLLGKGTFELWSGHADLARVTLGAESGAQGTLRVRAGVARVGQVDIGFGFGRLRVDGGELISDGPLAGDPTVSGGALRLAREGLAIGGDLTVAAGATLALPAGAPTGVGGAAVLDGATIEVETPSERIVLTAASVSAIDAVAPGGFTFAVRDNDLGQALVLVADSGELPDPPDDGDADDDGDAAADCGCRHGGGAAWLAPLALLLRRRRR
jgi:hypothetical protein